MSGKGNGNSEAGENRRLVWIYRVLSAVICLAMIGILVTVISWLPGFGNDTNPAENEVYTRYVENGPAEAGAVNTVADMILDYRAFDTLGESNVLLLAVCSVMILLRADRKRDGAPEIRELEQEPAAAPKDSILRGAAYVLTPAGIVYGICMVLNGHLSAGGGFSGGAVIGAALILYAAAFLYRRQRDRKHHPARHAGRDSLRRADPAAEYLRGHCGVLYDVRVLRAVPQGRLERWAVISTGILWKSRR